MIWPRISWTLTPKAKRKVSILGLLLLVVVMVVSSNWFWKFLYPYQHEEIIQQAANTYGIDPLMIAALINVESKFKTENVSHVGAVGLMQLMPETAAWVAEQSGTAYTGPGELADPTVNIRLGSWYLSYLNKQFKGNWVAVVAAYNGGEGRVNRWMSNGEWDGQLDTSDKIPVGETRHYVQRVFFNYEKYKKLYAP
ncbi:lytic transglycosylase domain-containing protein [Tumebacillus permanentifrigoris]|uniref:Soluble lytic murein transglycosylase n=1 Tax=Tumebacillus permanentifrigoris TaxID=378543 RepID=A0A316DA79_9BACL|nr:lytic transglycosylase domain-containing protein [Tumebacillus permanentifrigoris]PWK13889.1 soluble lytic murein transglycosylase [Tumebacillus permanentifrigoris]